MISKTLFPAMQEAVYGRDREIEHLLTLSIQALLAPRESLRPVATLFGQGGSGRRHLIATLASYLKRPFVTLDLSEITEESLHGNLKRLESESVLLLQNPEKAPVAIQHRLLALLEQPDFSAVLLFFSTRLGDRLYLDELFLEQFYHQPIRAGGAVMEQLSTHKDLTSALLSFMALGGTLLLSPPDLTMLFAIAQHELEQMRPSFEERSGIQMGLDHPHLLAQALTLALAPWLNAKRIKAHLPTLLLDTLLQAMKRRAVEPIAVRIRVSTAAAKSLKALTANTSTLGWRLSRDLDRIELKWQSRQQGDRLTLSLGALSLEPNTEEASDHGTLPAYRFSRGFDEIFGQKAAKKELEEMTALLKNPKRLERFSAPSPRGLLLHGPEGVGKSLLAQAFCARMGRPCFIITGSELFDEDHMALVYEQATRHGPAVVWLKDIDAKGVIQGVVTAVPTERLEKLIGRSNGSVFTVATAQSLEEVPDSLLDPGRLDWSVEIPDLDYEARKAFMDDLLKRPCAPEVRAGNLARYASGMNANELARFERHALLEAARRGLSEMDEPFLIEQINTVKYGHRLEGARLKNYRQELETTAYHEASHAIISTLLQPDKPIEQVTAAPRAGALGFVAYEIDDKLASLTRIEVQSALTVLMAGRLAQIKAFGQSRIDSGAADDLERATALAWAAVSSLGLDEELDFLSVGQLPEVLGFVPFAARIEARVQHWLESAQASARTLIDQHWGSIEKLASALIESETLEGKALDAILKPLRP